MSVFAPQVRIACGDALTMLRREPAGSVDCCVTSPPYWGLRDYGLPPTVWGGDLECAHDFSVASASRGMSGGVGNGTLHGSQQGDRKGGDLRFSPAASAFCARCGAWRGCLGLEPTPDLYVAHLVDVFREVRRVLRDDATAWLNLGDSFAASRSHQVRDSKHVDAGNSMAAAAPPGLKPKDLVGIPWRVAFALQADGWYLRSDIVWAKTAPMPESVRDRPTRAHEFVFLLSKSAKYWYDADAIREPHATGGHWRASSHELHAPGQKPQRGIRRAKTATTPHLAGRRQAPEPGEPNAFHTLGRNARDVWTLGPDPYPGAHFATFPAELARRCILAGCPEGGTVLDPFGGSGTVGAVAARHGRNAVLFDLKPDYCAMARRRVWPEAQPRLRLALGD